VRRRERGVELFGGRIVRQCGIVLAVRTMELATLVEQRSIARLCFKASRELHDLLVEVAVGASDTRAAYLAEVEQSSEARDSLRAERERH
jgi:hypothetical protein